MANTGGHADKDNYVDSGNVPDRDKDGREGFGDDGGTRVGHPDAAKNAGPSSDTAGHEGGLEGSILDDGDDDNSTRGGQQGTQQSKVQQASQGDAARGSSAQGGSAQGNSLGGGGEAAAGMHAAGKADAGTTGDGSEPLDRSREHKGSYGGEGGTPRTSSDQREPINPS
jgi:hypothetical protein